MSLLLAVNAFAAPGLTTYQAKIVKPDGLPLEANNVNFRFTILDPSASCILYSENFSAVNMNSTGGLISFSLGTGIKTYPASATTFAEVFSNVTANLSCDAGGPVNYSPAATDTRKIVMQFQDSNGWQTLPAMNINAVPYAMYASEAQKISGLPSCNPGEALNYNGVSFSCEAISGGGVTSSTITAALGYAPVAPASLTGLTAIGSNNTLPTGSSNSYALGRNNSQVTGGGGSNDSILLGFNNIIDNGGGGSNSGYVIGYNNKFNTFGGGSSEAFIFGSNNTVNYSGFVIGRGVSAPANNAIVIGNGYQTLNVMNDNRVGIGTSSPVTTLDVSGGVKVGVENATCDSTLAGTLRYNGLALEYCNGTAWSGFSGGAVTSSTVITALGYTPANSATVSSLNTTVNSVSSSVYSVSTTVTSLSTSVTSLTSTVNSNSSSITALTSTVNTHTVSITALYTWATSLSTTANTNSASLTALTSTVNNQVASITAVNTSLASLSAVVNTNSSSITALTSSVNTNSASLSTLASTVSGLTSSQWATSGSTINYQAGKVGVGVSAPISLLEIESNSGVSYDTATLTLSQYNSTAVAANSSVIFRRARGPSTAPTRINASDVIGGLYANGYYDDGSGNKGFASANSGAIRFIADENFVTSGTLGTKIVFDTTVSGAGTRSTKMTVAGNGAVGIGTTTPEYKLHIGGSTVSGPTPFGSENAIVVESVPTTGSAQGYVGSLWFGSRENSQTEGTAKAAGVVGYMPNDVTSSTADAELQFYTTPVGSITPQQRAVISSNGYFGIGTSAPRQILDVAPTTGNSIIRATSTNGTSALQLYRNTAGAYTGPVLWSNGTSLNFGYDSSENAGPTLMTLATTGALGIGTTNPTTIINAYQNNGADAAIALTNASAGQGAYLTSIAQSNFSGFTATGTGASWFSGQYGSTNYVIGDLTNGKIPFAIVANAPTNSFYMTASGSVGIGGVAATAKLHLAAGTSTAGTAPLKLTSGTLTSIPEAGALEYDGFNFYTTNGAGTRSQIGSGGGAVTSSSVISALGYTPVSSTAASQWTTSGTTINYTSGNIGIGTSNPTKLVTLSGVNIGMNFYDTTYATSLINLFNSGGNGNLELFSGASSVIKFSAQNNVDSYMNSGANFGVGTTTPGSRLGIKGAGATSATMALNVIDSANVPLLSVRNDGVVSIGASTRAGSLGINVTNPVYALEVSGTNVARFSNVETGGARLVMTNGSTGGKTWTLASTGSASTGGAGLFHIADYALGNIFSFKNDGSFGVNVATPLAPLHVASSTAYMLFEETDTTQKFYQGVDASRYFIRQGAATNSDLLTVTNGGNVGIGNSSPSFPLDIWTTGAFNARYVHTSNNANDDAAFIMARQRGTVASPLAVQSGDAIGGFYFRPYDGTSMNNTTAYIEVAAAQNQTTSLRGNYMTFATTVSGTNSNQEIMRIHSNGYVGIGTTNPNNLLQVGPSGGNATNYGIYVASYNSNAGQAQYTGNWANTDWWGIGPATNSGSDNTIRIGNISDRTGTWSGTQNLNLMANAFTVGTQATADDNGDYTIKSNGQLHLVANGSGTSNTSYVHLILEAGTATSSNSAVVMQTLGSERMRVNYNGNVGIGTTSPASKLDVNGYSSGAGVGTMFIRNSYNSGGTKYWQIGPDGNGSGNFVVYNDGLAGAYIVYGQTTWSSSSDRRLKKEIEPIEDGLNKLLQLNGVTYHYNHDAVSDPRKAGVIAQDVEKVLPEAVTKDDKGFLAAKYTEIIPLVIEGVKQLYNKVVGHDVQLEQQAREIASVKAENAVKDQKIKELEERLEKIEKALQNQSK